MARSPIKRFRFLAARRTTTSPPVGKSILLNTDPDDHLIMQEPGNFSAIAHISAETGTPILSRNRSLL